MTTRPPADVTALLERWRTGSDEASEELIAAVYQELRRLASSYLRRERAGHTLQATAIVNEAYLRLVPQRRVTWQNRAQFFGVAAQMMRRVLVDHARRRLASKRGAPEPVTVSNIADPRGGGELDVLAVHEALNDLERFNARQALVIELRFFSGLSIEEIGAVLDLSPATVKRELTSGRLWLRGRLAGKT